MKASAASFLKKIIDTFHETNNKTMKHILLFLLSLSTLGIQAQELYVKTFGKPTAKPILFLHGGPGYNAAAFEISTAQPLADQGYFVVVYDRRGEGRSPDANARFNFEQSFADIDNLCKKYKLKGVNLMGHSFGGVLAVLYAEKNPQAVGSVILVSAPLALQESFKTIQNTSKDIYKSNGDKTNLDYVELLEKMDPSSMEYATFTFMHAMRNGFYKPKAPTAEANAIYKAIAADPNFKYVQEMSREAPLGFWKNEKYTSLDLTKDIQTLVDRKMNVFAIYGKEDGLHSAQQVDALTAIVGKGHSVYLDNASHNVFIDQQAAFLETVKSFMK